MLKPIIKRILILLKLAWVLKKLFYKGQGNMEQRERWFFNNSEYNSKVVGVVVVKRGESKPIH